MATTIIFFILAAIILICAVAAVTTKRIMRSATYLLFVLFGTAGLYFLMGYTFLGAVQVMVYAGGVVVLYIFALMLTGQQDNKGIQRPRAIKYIAAIMAALIGAALFLFIIISHQFINNSPLDTPSEQTASIQTLGKLLLSTGENGYMLPFEAVSVLLLACIIGALIIARKR